MCSWIIACCVIWPKNRKEKKETGRYTGTKWQSYALIPNTHTDKNEWNSLFHSCYLHMIAARCSLLLHFLCFFFFNFCWLPRIVFIQLHSISIKYRDGHTKDFLRKSIPPFFFWSTTIVLFVVSKRKKNELSK